MAFVVPLFLDDVGMAVHNDVAARGKYFTEVPGALVADLLATGIEPGVQERIGCRFVLLVRGHINRAICIEITIRADRCATGGEVRAGVRHGRIDGVTPKEAMVGAESSEAAR